MGSRGDQLGTRKLTPHGQLPLRSRNGRPGKPSFVRRSSDWRGLRRRGAPEDPVASGEHDARHDVGGGGSCCLIFRQSSFSVLQLLLAAPVAAALDQLPGGGDVAERALPGVRLHGVEEAGAVEVNVG